MAELRWNPLTRDWVMIASHRQARPQMPEGWCPFCPEFGAVPEGFTVLEYDNDFPALTQTPPEPDDVGTEFFKTAPCYGKCEVILYSPEHNAHITDLSPEHMTELVGLWQERFSLMSADERIKYVFIFENRGKEVGVTMPHPHGQIYGYSYLPKKLELETASAREHYESTGHCLFCDTLNNEAEDGRRMIFSNEYFSVYLPFYCEYPYGVYIMAKEHRQYITQFVGEEKKALADIIKQTVGMLDTLFDCPFPYMMCMHNAPVNMGDYSKDFHFHIEFFPPLRSADKLKFNASSETGAWAHCNPTCPEATAKELRAAHKRYSEKKEC